MIGLVLPYAVPVDAGPVGGQAVLDGDL
jgi:hypothetical protein